MTKKVLWLLAAVATGLYICGSLIDPDLWWHITVGRWILNHQAIPVTDHWNMFGVGNPWRAYSWLPEVLFAFSELNYGIYGLLILKIGIALLLALSLFYCLGKIAQDRFVGALLAMIATAACFDHFTLRPQVLAWICFCWLLYSCHKISAQDLTKAYAAEIFLIMALWANTHLSTVLGLAALFLWTYSERESRRPKVAVYVLIVAFLGTLLTPYAGGEWLTFFSKADHPFKHSGIAEFKAATITEYSTVFLLLLVMMLLGLLYKRPKSIELPRLFACLAFVLGALAVIKFLPFAVIVIASTIALLWGREKNTFRESDSLAYGILNLNQQFFKVPAGVWIILFACTIPANLYQLWRSPVAKDFVPVEALDFIQGNNLPLPLLNIFGEGGYIMYRYSNRAGEPSFLVPVDGRTNVTPDEILKKHDSALNGLLTWNEYFEAVKPKTVLWPRQSSLPAILVATGQWCLVYKDGGPTKGHAVLVKKEVFEERKGVLKAENC